MALFRGRWFTESGQMVHGVWAELEPDIARYPMVDRLCSTTASDRQDTWGYKTTVLSLNDEAFQASKRLIMSDPLGWER